MNESEEAQRREASRRSRNEEVLAGIRRRNPGFKLPDGVDVRRGGFTTESTTAFTPEATARATQRAFVVETIVRDQRPVLFVKDDWVIIQDADLSGVEAQQLFGLLSAGTDKLKPLIPLVGRVNVANFPGSDYVGTGWFVDTDIVVTNRHVAELIGRREGQKFVFAQGIGGVQMSGSLTTTREFDDLQDDVERTFDIKDILYIEPEHGPNDIAFLRVARQVSGERPFKIDVAAADAGPDVPVVTVGYPARAPRSVIPDQARMEALYHGRYDIKRAAPGFTMAEEQGNGRHDCTTLGGNSGSVVLDIKTGKAVGLHFAGLYQEANYTVRASTLIDYINKKRWYFPPNIETGSVTTAAQLAAAAAAAVTVTPPGSVTIPLSITITIGSPVAGGSGGAADGGGGGARRPPGLASAEAAVQSFWKSHQAGVVAARVGFGAAGDRIGDEPHIAASLLPSGIAAAATLPQEWEGVPVRYYAATVEEQLDGQKITEAGSQIAYDDDQRTGNDFSFAEIRDEDIDVIAHVGPEYSWEVLKDFLGDGGDLVSAIYEFHGDLIRKALEARLQGGAALTLVYDNATLHGEEFDPEKTFSGWRRSFGDKFERMQVPEGAGGLISNAYHIKVTVRDDDRLWLSSGNWKASSSQPVITRAQLDNAANVDLPGNREWHVVVQSKKLSARFRSHIRQDLKRSKDLRGLENPQLMVEVPPVLETVVLERRPPSRVIEPKQFTGRIPIKPLLTPDQRGAVYSGAVLELIRSAEQSLLFQIPYIGMPSNPTKSRGFIDDLINALIEKLKTLPDAKVLLRNGGDRLSSPAHAAWYFKSKGVDIDNRLRRIDDHHTKGMIVDGKRVLIGSHNWSDAGVTVNRDASLIFDHQGLAQYYAEAFEVDWNRANPIAPRRYVKKESAAMESMAAQAQRVPLAAILSDEFFS